MTVKIVLWRDRERGNWMRTDYRAPDGLARADSTVTPYSTAELAGDVAAMIARANPGAEIGIRSESIGDRVGLMYGPVVWLRKGFEIGRPDLVTRRGAQMGVAGEAIERGDVVSLVDGVLMKAAGQ